MSGLFAANGTSMAYMNAQRTGKDRNAEVSLTEGWVRAIDDNFTLWTGERLLRQRQGIK